MAKKEYIINPTLFGQPEVIGFGSSDFYVKEIAKQKSKAIIIKNHYSHKVCTDGTTHIHLGCFINGEMLGVLQFGYAMNPQSMGSVVKGTEIEQYKELNRMWFDDKAKRNTESMAISYSIKYIKRKYPRVKWIQSFADERCGGFGIVYQACNFDFFGEHENIFYEVDDEVYHKSRVAFDQKTISKNNRYIPLEKAERAIKKSLRQFRYIYFLDKRWKKDCLLKEKPYPKHYDNSNGFEKTKAGRAFKKYGEYVETPLNELN